MGLECHGHGEKPAWMDRGAKQKAQAVKIKQKVAEMTRQRRMNRINDRYESSLKGPRRNSQAGISNVSQGTNSTTTPPNQPIDDQEIYVSHPSTGFFLCDRNQISMVPRNDITDSNFSSTGTSLTGFQTSLYEMASFLSESYVLEDDVIHPHEINLPVNGFVLPEPDVFSEAKTPVLGTLPNTDSTVTDNKSMLAINNVEEAVLLAYYIDKVFCWQFRFGALYLQDFNQGHVLWLVSKSDSLYHATLALSDTHRSLQQDLKRPSADLSNGEHTPRYDLAIKELQHDLKDPKSRDDALILACIMMFLYSAVSCLSPLSFSRRLH